MECWNILKHTKKERLGWNEITVSITKYKLIKPQRHEDNVYIYNYTDCWPQNKRLSHANISDKQVWQWLHNWCQMSDETLNLCFKKGVMFVSTSWISLNWTSISNVVLRKFSNVQPSCKGKISSGVQLSSIERKKCGISWFKDQVYTNCLYLAKAPLYLL